MTIDIHRLLVAESSHSTTADSRDLTVHFRVLIQSVNAVENIGGDWSPP